METRELEYSGGLREGLWWGVGGGGGGGVEHSMSLRTVPVLRLLSLAGWSPVVVSLKPETGRER